MKETSKKISRILLTQFLLLLIAFSIFSGGVSITTKSALAQNANSFQPVTPGQIRTSSDNGNNMLKAVRHNNIIKNNTSIISELSERSPNHSLRSSSTPSQIRRSNPSVDSNSFSLIPAQQDLNRKANVQQLAPVYGSLFGTFHRAVIIPFGGHLDVT